MVSKSNRLSSSSFFVLEEYLLWSMIYRDYIALILNPIMFSLSMDLCVTLSMWKPWTIFIDFYDKFIFNCFAVLFFVQLLIHSIAFEWGIKLLNLSSFPFSLDLSPHSLYFIYQTKVNFCCYQENHCGSFFTLIAICLVLRNPHCEWYAWTHFAKLENNCGAVCVYVDRYTY